MPAAVGARSRRNAPHVLGRAEGDAGGPLGLPARARDRPAADAGRRRNGAADRRGRHPRAAPPERVAGAAPRRARALLRDPRPVARVPRPRPGIAWHAPRRRDRDHGRRARRLPRARAGGRSSAGRCSPPRCRPAFGIYIDRFTFPFVGIHELPTWVGDRSDDRLGRRTHEHGQLPRRDGRPRGGRLRDRRLHVRRDRALAGEADARGLLRDRRGGVLRLPAPQLLSGADLHGGLRRAAARLRAGDRCRSRGF